METQQHSSAEAVIKTRLSNKLHPDNFTQMTDTMAAVVGYLLDVPFVQPRITAITVADNCLLVLGHYRDLVRNWHHCSGRQA